MIASVLNTTISIVERMLPFRVDWLERIAFLAAEFASVAAAAGEQTGSGPEPGGTGFGETDDAGLPGSLPLHAAYHELWEFIQNIKVDGLHFDSPWPMRSSARPA